MSSESYEWGWLNVSGVRGSLEEVVQFMDEHDFSFLILGETWLKPLEPLRHPSIVFDLRYPSRDPSKGRGIHGLMVVRNPKLTKYSDFEEVKRDSEHHSYIWFKFRGSLFGGIYLPPSMELATCIESVLSASEVMAGSGNEDPVILVGDMNMRLGRYTGDLITNLRSNIRYTLQDLGLWWIRPNSGKWTVHTSRGRSIVDYIFVNQRARGQVVESRVWEDDYIAGSDHRLVSCVVKPWLASPPVTISDVGGFKLTNSHSRIRKGDLKNPQVRAAVVREFKAGRKQAKEAIITQLGPLLCPGHASKRGEVQRRLDEASSVVKGYITDSLARGGLRPKAVRSASSKAFWDHSLTQIKKERNRLWKAAINHPSGSAEAVFLEGRAKEAQKRLQREVRLRKRRGFVTFADDIASKPVTEAMKQMSSIKRRLQDPSRVPGPGLSTDKLDAYAEYFAQVFRSDTWQCPPDSKRITSTEDMGLTYCELFEAVKRMPNNKAPGPDGVTAEILKLGGQALVSVMYPLYRAVRRWGLVPSDWNVAALQLIWKAKGRRDDVDKYRPIALTSIFRKVLEKTMMVRLQAIGEGLDIAQGGFRKGKSTYDLILALDMIIRDRQRKGNPSWIAFLDIKGAYDTVNRDILWSRCRRMGIKGGDLNLLRCLFDEASATVRIGGQMSRRIPMGRGVLQGSLLSPMLFNIFIDTLPRILRRKHPSFLLGSSRVNSFLYADDIVLISSSEEHLQRMLNTCEQHSISHGYVFSPSKCEIIAPEGTQTSYIMMYEEQVKQSPSFKYLGVPFNDKGVDIAGLCVEGISRAVKTANLFRTVGCNGTGFSPRVNKWILTSFVRPQMEYGLGLTYLGTGLENAVNKAWGRMWRKALSLPPQTSGLGILKMMREPDMAFRARKLNAMMLDRAYKANPNTLLGNVYRFATDGPGRRTKKSMIVRSRRNPMVRNSPPGDYDYLREEWDYAAQHNPQAPCIVASRIKCSGKGIDGFLKSAPSVRAGRDIVRKLLLWKTGVVPGKPQQCQKCGGTAQATRDHIVECSGLKKDIEGIIQPEEMGGHNVLDAALNEKRIWRSPEIWTKVKKGLQTVWSKCLGRKWNSSHEGNPGAEQKVNS